MHTGVAGHAQSGMVGPGRVGQVGRAGRQGRERAWYGMVWYGMGTVWVWYGYGTV